jgi:hypothetical protein
MYRSNEASVLGRRQAPQRIIILATLVAVAVALFGGAAFGQQLTATLSGTAYDQAGAVVPGAKIELINDASGDVRRSVTNGEGYFNITALPPGAYTLNISAQGFNRWQTKGITLNQGDSRVVSNVSLKVGASEEQIEVVSGSESVAPISSGEVSTTLNTEMVQELSLQGRDAGELLKIMPGAALNNGLSQGSSFGDQVVGSNTGPVGAYSISGTQPYGAMSFMLDGANLVDPGNAGTQIANINQDMTAEVKVLMSSYSAEFAKGPVVFQAFGKSGGNKFHGEAYLYARNQVLNSGDWYNNSQAYTPASSYYYYPGGNVGGPIPLPHLKNKLFFWFGYEYMIQHPAGSVSEYFVPTPQMVAGNFSPSYLATLPNNGGWSNSLNVPCANATNGGCPGLSIVNGMVPQSQFDPNGIAYLKLYPQPNIDPGSHGGLNYQFANTSPQNRYEQSEKIDYAPSDSTKLTVSYTYQLEHDQHPIDTWWAPSQAVPYPSPMVANTPSTVVMANVTHVFSPTLVNEAVFTYARYINGLSLSNPAAVDPTKLGMTFKGLFGVSEKQIPDVLSWSGGLAEFMPQATYYGPFQGGEFGAVKSDPAFSDNLSKVAGTHALKFGFYWDQNGNNQSNTGLEGQFEFETYGSTTTNNTIADMLTGHAQSYTQKNTVPLSNLKYNTIALYAQDSWKANKKLTINYGIRMDHVGQYYDSQGLVAFNQALYSNAGNAPSNTGLEWHSINSNVPISVWKTPKVGYPDPRIGVAYDLFGNAKTVLRGGLAIFRYQYGTGTVSNADAESSGSFSYSTGSGLTSLAGINSLTGLPTGYSLNGTTIYTMGLGDGKMPATMNWNVTVSQAAPWRSVFEVSYVANKSWDLITIGSNSKVNDPNAIQPGAYFRPDPLTGTTSCIPGNCQNLNSNDYFPLQNYQDIYEAGHGSYANYNSLQAAWHKQSGRVLYMVNYTFSKVLGDRDGVSENGAAAGSQINPFVQSANYGVLAYDHSQVFNFAYVIHLPKPIHGNPVLAQAVNGWELSGVTQAQSGAPIQPNTGGDLNVQWGTSNIPFAGSTGGSVSNSSWLGTNALTLVPLVTCDPRSNLKSGQYFNPSCFTVPPVGQNGTVVWPYIHGPHYINSDLSLYKNFKIGEGSKRIQFRMQAFNFLNHPNPQFGTGGNNDITLKFADPSSGASVPTNTNPQTTGTPLYKVGSRLMEFAVKFYF